MCGFVGFTNKINDASIVLGKMMDRIKHRGPDSDGKYVDEQIAMGFRRLSIIDLSDQGSQPIFNEDKSLVLTFNGEIYNYKDLREELVASGHKFYTQTDSEVLIHGYEQWGEDIARQAERYVCIRYLQQEHKRGFRCKRFLRYQASLLRKNGRNSYVGF